MSGAVDTKTVEMRFDNSDFEKNTKQSISTLAKLKAALKLDGASSSLKEIEKASKKLEFKEVNKSLDETGKKFKILETIATGALLKIGASAAEVGMKVAKSLTVDQVASGWNKYEQKVTAVQTIMSNLRGEENKFADDADKMDYVNFYLNKLTKFSDETSYSFSTMTDSLGKWIANGRSLKESAVAIQGVATWAAAAGQRTDAFARAVYNVSQAFGVGAMTTIDWKSIENANMATAQFKELAIQTAVTMGKLKEGQVTVESFRESLQKKWFDNDVMMSVFTEYGAAAEKVLTMSTETGKSVEMVMKQLRESTKAEDQEFVNSLSFKAFEAAQAAKTFSEVIEATADATSTKWTQIFENVFGNYLQAKELWSDFSVAMWEIFASPLDTLNDIMSTWNRGFFADGPKNVLQKWFESGDLDDLNNGLQYVSKSIAEEAVSADSATYSIKKLEDGTTRLYKTEKQADGTIKSFYKTVYDGESDLISGREQLLQGFSNVFDTFFHDVVKTNENGADYFASRSIFGSIKKSLQEVIWGTSDADELVPLLGKKLWNLTNRFKELTESLKPSLRTSRKLETAFKGLFTLFKMAGKFIGAVIKPFKNLFGKLLKSGSKTLLDLSEKMGKWVLKLEEFLEENKVFDKVSQKITDGLDAIGKGLNNLSLALTGMTIKDLGKYIKEKVFSFFDNYDFKGTFNKVKDFFSKTYKSIREGINSISTYLTGMSAKDLYAKAKETIVGFFENYDFKGTFSKVGDFFKGAVTSIKQISTGDLPEKLTPLQKFWYGAKDIFEGMKNFFKSISSAFDWVCNFIGGVFSKIASAFKNRNNITEIEDAETALDGLKRVFEGICNFFKPLGPVLGKIGKGIGQFFTDLGGALAAWGEGKDPSEILEQIINSGFIISLTRLINSIAKIFHGFGGIGVNLSKDLGALKKVLNAYAREINAQAILDIAIAIGIMAGSMWVLSKIPADDMKKVETLLWSIVGALGALTAVKEGLSWLKNKGGSVKEVAKTVLSPIESLKETFITILSQSIFANDSTAKFVKIALGILFAALAAKTLVNAVQKAGEAFSSLSKLSEEEIQKGGRIFAQVIVIFGVFAFLAGFSHTATAALFAAIAGYVLVKAIVKLVDAMAELGSSEEKMDNIKKVADKFKGFFDGIKQIVKWIVIIAAAIAIVQLVLAGFASKKGIISRGVANSIKQFGKNFTRIAISLIIVAAAFAIMGGVVSSMSPGTFWKVAGFFAVFIAIVGILGLVGAGLTKSLIGAKDVFSAAPGVLKQFGKLFERVALALLIVVAAFWLFSKIKFESTSIGVIALIFGIFILAVGLLGLLALSVASDPLKGVGNKFKKAMGSIALLFIAVAASLAIVAGAFKIMDGLDMSGGRLLGISGIFAGFILAVGLLAKFAKGIAGGYLVGKGGKMINSSKNFSRVMGSIALLFIAVAASLAIVAGAFKIMDGLDMSGGRLTGVSFIFAGFIVLVGILALLMANITKTSKSSVSTIGAILSTAVLFVAVAGSLLLVANAVSLLEGVEISWQVLALFGGFLLLVGAMAVLGAALSKSWVGFATILASAVLFLAAAYSLKMVAEAVSVLSGLNIPNSVLIALGVFMVLVIAMGAIGGALGTTGLGILGIVAMAALVVAAAFALQLVAGALSGLLDAISRADMTKVSQILDLFGDVLVKLAILAAIGSVGGTGLLMIAIFLVGIAAACLIAAIAIKLIVDSFTNLMNAFTKMVMTIALYGPLFVKSIKEVIESLLDTLIELKPKIIKAIKSVVGGIVTGFLLGIDENIDLISAIAALLPLAIFTGFISGLAENLPDMIDSLKTGLDTVLDGIDQLAELFGNAGQRLIAHMFAGMIDGLGQIGPFIRAAFEYVKDAAAHKGNATKDIDYYMEKQGVNYAKALAEGEKKGSGDVKKSAEEDARTWTDAYIAERAKAYADASFLQSVAENADNPALPILSKRGYEILIKQETERLVAEREKALKDNPVEVTPNVAEPSSSQKTKSEEAVSKVIEGLKRKYNIPLDGTLYFSNLNEADLSSVMSSLGIDIPVDGIDMSSFNLSDYLAQSGIEIPDELKEQLSTATEEGAKSGFRGAVSGKGALGYMADLSSGLKQNLGPAFSGATSEIESVLEESVGPISAQAENLASAVEAPLLGIDSFSWGADAGQGLASGLMSKSGAVMAAASYLAGIIHSILGFSEPERGPLSDFHTYAPDMIKLWCSGIRNNLGSITATSKEMSGVLGDSMSDALGYVSGLIDNGMTDELTLRPVMDLTNIQNGVDSMSSMLNDSNYVVNGTARLASEASSQMNGGAMATPENSELAAGSVGPTSNNFYIMGGDPNVIADKVSKILADQTRRQKAVWARRR